MADELSTPDPAFERIAAVVWAAYGLGRLDMGTRLTAREFAAMARALAALTPEDLARCGVTK